MQYMLLIYGDEKAMETVTREEGQAIMAAYTAYTDALREAGAFVAGAPLESTASATTVRIEGGKTHVLDGPFAETKEQFAGYYLIEVANADEALRWAARCPGANRGSVEVRPVMAIPVG